MSDDARRLHARLLTTIRRRLASVAGKNRLRWGVRGVRLGWWVGATTGETIALFGPSICSSSGGGPARALALARARFPDLGGAWEVEAPEEHELFDEDQVCTRCVPEASGLAEGRR